MPKRPRKTTIPHPFVLDAISQLSPRTHPMFGCLAVYVGNKIVLILRDKPATTADNGVWLATTQEHHESLRREFPSMRSIEVFKTNVTGWQVLPADAPDFEEAALHACELILTRDPRIGKVPGIGRVRSRASASSKLPVPSAIPNVLVIHWDPVEAEPLCGRLRREGFAASPYPHRGDKGFRSISETPPGAVVIDLLRLPSYGRTMGALLRERKSTRMIPLVFIEGDPEKTRRVRELLPDAVFTDLRRLGPSVRQAIRRAPREPVIPDSSGIPLHEKLRIREGTVITLLHAPAGFKTKLAPLPEGARFQTETADADVILAFFKSPAGLGRELPALAREIRKGRTLWLIWPKKSGSRTMSLTMPSIREMCRETGLIDYKVCAVDEVWSGMAVALKRS